ncbi:adaptor protein family protein [Entamoeba histolytica HM-1:IMSS-B]|uniref:AP complex subunit beta n=7 Tax=Entamoeba histolytica TaxID=5759 RepID=A0A8U0WPZ3_ENTH1|nr:adaptor protein (AP) family protein [Entamoeba histolytica HM-1:IMSS]EMD44734.1 AP2 complex subunit beta-1, putative [Entamoeba histolytica KU27]EMH73361.1 adaptor protein family protein [Entamoeba histolytica HM-1:IMSS-B]EMS11988.1 AP-2 complex subunit beta-1, putative [Entamoeba histolytica HM-3:IMSS]ENY60815.1 AP-2 complex subunit beta-1, putative [Entamoeba histolytica HM-1:IMSS-A]BAE94782.1 beta subunit isoform a [Entamoeba histolytica]|eukprot:XP_649291.1 adaptor protein (AP) family protein [Entamoeba histolytica HM-1:IMSS]
MSKKGNMKARVADTQDLREMLTNKKESERIEGLKIVISQMTEGKDVGILFGEVLQCVATPNIDAKKLAYLYIMNYAKTQQDNATRAVQAFLRDSNDPNPIIRALAIRTMGAIRVPKVTQELYNPLQKALKDQDPYVRKTAAMCVAKLYFLNQEECVRQGFVNTLKELIFDSNHVVVANALAALNEINSMSEKHDVFEVTSENYNILLTALNKCANEWGQVIILDTISKYVPENVQIAESICEQVAPRLKAANSAVVLAAVKLILVLLPHLSEQNASLYLKKIAPPLGTLMSASKAYEIQYVALRNIRLILQKCKDLLVNDVKIFYCKYNDPLYIKIEKLEIIVALANKDNIKEILSEFVDYSQMGDVEFVRKAVRALGRCAIKLENVANQCITTLVDLINTKVNYIVQEAIVVIRDIFRRYPNRYEKVIGTLCENLDSLDEPEAKAAMIWIIGEYSDRITNVADLLQMFLETFQEEDINVQLQLLTATVKSFLKASLEDQDVLQNLFTMCTESDNPDLRDRGLFYWRLLAHDPELAKEMVCSEKPVIKDDSEELDQAVLVKLIPHIGSLASLLHKPPEVFVSSLKAQAGGFNFKNLETLGEEFSSDDEDDIQINTQPANTKSLLDFGDVTTPAQPTAAPAQQAPQQQSVMSLFDNLNTTTPAQSTPAQPVQQQQNIYATLYGQPTQPVQQQPALFATPGVQPQAAPAQPQQTNKPAVDLSFLGI